MALSNCKLPPYHPFSFSLKAPRPVCWVGLTPVLDSRMGFKCPTSTSYHPGHSGWFRDAHVTHLRPIKQEDSSPGLRFQEWAVREADSYHLYWLKARSKKPGEVLVATFWSQEKEPRLALGSQHWEMERNQVLAMLMELLLDFQLINVLIN